MWVFMEHPVVEHHIPPRQKPSVTMCIFMNYLIAPEARGGDEVGGRLASVAVVVSKSTPSVSHHITHSHTNTSTHTLHTSLGMCHTMVPPY